MQKRFKVSLVFLLALILLNTKGTFAQVHLAFSDTDIPFEACATCHYKSGTNHQAIYNKYTDKSAFEVTIDNVESIDNGNDTFDVTVTFTIKKYDMPYIDANGLPSLDQMRVYAVTYDSATEMFDDDYRLSNGGSGVIALGGGQYSVTSTMDYAPELSNAEVYIYIADGELDTEGMTLYDNVYNIGEEFGDVDTYESAANVSGCEKCHGTPYYKHGYRAAKVAGLPDFAACKTCHYDTKTGDHQDWQIIVDNPARYAEIFYNNEDLTPEEEAKYAYTANVMNDVHMSHAMEFPYPQSMSNCVTCHEGKLDKILTTDTFNARTCKSCHPVTGPADANDIEPGRAPALKSIMPATYHYYMFDNDTLDITDCALCHRPGGVGPEFKDIHSGYNKLIYTSDGLRYSDAIAVTIDSTSLENNILTIQFSATVDPNLTGFAADSNNISPTVYAALYGYNTKDFLARITATKVSGAAGAWIYTADLSSYADNIAAGIIRRVEIGVRPALKNSDGDAIALIAPSKTFDLSTQQFVNFYSDIVDVNKCDDCHDALATTFHSADRGGNIVVCRMCHVPTSGASHLEMQSRSIDSYVHAIHSFQAFDIGDVNFADPVEALRYDLHIEHVYPNFTIKNCESCHIEGTYNVPDQSKSLPGILSASDYPLMNDVRNIGNVPQYIAGPTSRACGSCHRADLIKEDDYNRLLSFNQHTKQNGYLIPGGDDSSSVLDDVINWIMSLFE